MSAQVRNDLPPAARPRVANPGDHNSGCRYLHYYNLSKVLFRVRLVRHCAHVRHLVRSGICLKADYLSLHPLWGTKPHAERQADGVQKAVTARDAPTVTPPEVRLQGLSERLAPARILLELRSADAQPQLQQRATNRKVAQGPHIPAVAARQRRSAIRAARPADRQTAQDLHDVADNSPTLDITWAGLTLRSTHPCPRAASLPDPKRCDFMIRCRNLHEM